MSENQWITVGISMPPSLARMSRVEAAVRGKSRSRLVRDILTEWLEKEAAADAVGNHEREATARVA